MSIFGESQAEKDEFKIIDRVLKNEERMLENESRLLKIVEKLIPHHTGKIRPILAFQYFNNNKNLNYMAQVTNLTLTSTAPITLSMTVVDANNNNAEIAGVLSGLSYAPADPTQDVAVVDATDPLSVDIHAVANTGGTTVTGSGTFVSTLKNTDGSPAFSGTVTGQLILVNNIPVAVLNPVLAFNQ